LSAPPQPSGHVEGNDRREQQRRHPLDDAGRERADGRDTHRRREQRIAARGLDPVEQVHAALPEAQVVALSRCECGEVLRQEDDAAREPHRRLQAGAPLHRR
jgi:hypothetical protein